ncbi:hypothetical protein [Streptomyces sp. NPDC058280]|uniref:hypothetical protein n=1 Tax=Streptomyces sp. NPDC058280 TaxID=3346419 RepID=UPI0036E64BCB
MPTGVQQPLAVLFTLPDGVLHHGILHDLPNQQMAADLAAGLVAATHPHGPIRTRSVARQYMTTMRRMARDLDAWGVTGGLADLTPATLVQYWLTCDYHRERRIRVVLNAFQETVGGLDPGICRHLAGRRINKTEKSRPNQPYSDGEWQRLEAACTERIAAASRVRLQALEAAERGADPSVHGVTFDNLAWLWLNAGPAVGEKDHRAARHSAHRHRPISDHSSRNGAVPGYGHGVRLPHPVRDAHGHRP